MLDGQRAIATNFDQLARNAPDASGAEFTCFTRTKVRWVLSLLPFD